MRVKWSNPRNELWPQAKYRPTNLLCARVYCRTDYSPDVEKSGEHERLILRVLVYSEDPPVWITVDRTFASMPDLKSYLTRFLYRYNFVAPKIIPRPQKKFNSFFRVSYNRHITLVRNKFYARYIKPARIHWT